MEIKTLEVVHSYGEGAVLSGVQWRPSAYYENMVLWRRQNAHNPEVIVSRVVPRETLVLQAAIDAIAALFGATT